MVVIRVCPRCGLPYSYIERRVVGGRVYLYAVHVSKVREGGRSKRKVRKCYLGPEDSYEYVSKLHEREGIVLRGLADRQRIIKYLDAIIRYIESNGDPETLSKIRARLERALDIVNAKLGGRGGDGAV